MLALDTVSCLYVNNRRKRTEVPLGETLLLLLLLGMMIRVRHLASQMRGYGRWKIRRDVVGMLLEKIIIKISSPPGMSNASHRWFSFINASCFSSQHSLSPSGSIFIRSNASSDEENVGGVTGTMTVGTNPNLSETEVVLRVNAASSSSKLLSNTGTCFNDAGNDRGLFLYVRRRNSRTCSLTYFCGPFSVIKQYLQHGLPRA